MRDSDPEIKPLLDLAQKVEGNARHISVHAAAVIVGPDDLVKYTPLQSETGGGDRIITQYEMHACEDVGLIKLDILGIANLTILANAVKTVETLHQIKINIKKIPLDDKETYEMLARGETFGVFQLSGGGMTKYLMDLHPERIEDVMAIVEIHKVRSEEHTSELQSLTNLVCRLLLEKKKKTHEMGEDAQHQLSQCGTTA